jgi:hypothetical protein
VSGLNGVNSAVSRNSKKLSKEVRILYVEKSMTGDASQGSDVVWD